MQSGNRGTLKWDLQAGGGHSMLFGLAVFVLTIATQEIIMLAYGLGPFEFGGEVFLAIPAWAILIILLIAAFITSGALLPMFDRLMKSWGKLGNVTVEGTKLRIDKGVVHEFDLSRPLSIDATWDVLVYKDPDNLVEPMSTLVTVVLRQGNLHVTILAVAELQEFNGFKLPRIQEGPERDLETSKVAASMNFDHLRQMLFEISQRIL